MGTPRCTGQLQTCCEVAVLPQKNALPFRHFEVDAVLQAVFLQQSFAGFIWVVFPLFLASRAML